MPTAIKHPAPVTVNFADDGTIPNNPTLALVLYRNGIDLAGTPDPERLIEKTFADSMIHEALGVARGRATVRFGGDNGREIEIAAGDVAILPAGTGHQCLSRSPDLLVIGAYPPSGKYDLCRGSKADHARALASIPQVPLPAADPVFGPKGPLVALWRP